MNETELSARFDAVIDEIRQRFWDRDQDPDAACDVRRKERKIRRDITQPRHTHTWFAYTVSEEQLEKLTARAIADDFMHASDEALAEEERESKHRGMG